MLEGYLVHIHHTREPGVGYLRQGSSENTFTNFQIQGKGKDYVEALEDVAPV